VGAVLAWREGRTRPALRRAAALGTAWVALVLAIQVANPGGFARYMYATLPALAGFSGFALSRVERGRAPAAALAVALGVSALAFLVLRLAGVPAAAMRRGDADHQRVLAALDRDAPAGPVLALVGEPDDAANFVSFHRGRAVRALPSAATEDERPPPGGAPRHALVDDRARDAVLEAGAVEVAHGHVYSLVRLDPRGGR
jgi:hypothetical protein